MVWWPKVRTLWKTGMVKCVSVHLCWKTNGGLKAERWYTQLVFLTCWEERFQESGVKPSSWQKSMKTRHSWTDRRGQCERGSCSEHVVLGTTAKLYKYVMENGRSRAIDCSGIFREDGSGQATVWRHVLQRTSLWSHQYSVGFQRMSAGTTPKLETWT